MNFLFIFKFYWMLFDFMKIKSKFNKTHIFIFTKQKKSLKSINLLHYYNFWEIEYFWTLNFSTFLSYKFVNGRIHNLSMSLFVYFLIFLFFWKRYCHLWVVWFQNNEMRQKSLFVYLCFVATFVVSLKLKFESNYFFPFKNALKWWVSLIVCFSVVWNE